MKSSRDKLDSQLKEEQTAKHRKITYNIWVSYVIQFFLFFRNIFLIYIFFYVGAYLFIYVRFSVLEKQFESTRQSLNECERDLAHHKNELESANKKLDQLKKVIALKQFIVLLIRTNIIFHDEWDSLLWLGQV